MKLTTLVECLFSLKTCVLATVLFQGCAGGAKLSTEDLQFFRSPKVVYIAPVSTNWGPASGIHASFTPQLTTAVRKTDLFILESQDETQSTESQHTPSSPDEQKALEYARAINADVVLCTVLNYRSQNDPDFQVIVAHIILRFLRTDSGTKILEIDKSQQWEGMRSGLAPINELTLKVINDAVHDLQLKLSK